MAHTSRIFSRYTSGIPRGTGAHYGRSMDRIDLLPTGYGHGDVLRSSALTQSSGRTDQFTDITETSFVRSGEPETPHRRHAPSPGRCFFMRRVVIALVMLCMFLISGLTVTTVLILQYKGATMASSPTKPTSTPPHDGIISNLVFTRSSPTTTPTAATTTTSTASPTTTFTAATTTTSTAATTTTTTASPTTTSTASPTTTSTSSPTTTSTASPNTTSTAATTTISTAAPTTTSTVAPTTTSTAAPTTTTTSSPTTTSNASPTTTSTAATTTTTTVSPTTTSTASPTTTSTAAPTTTSTAAPATTTTTATTSTTSTTTGCTVSRKCHVCTSRNARCPANGNFAGTDPGEVITCPCGTACYSDVRYDDENIVHRGCTRDFPQWEETSSKDPTCQEIGRHFLCFCQGDRCNTHDMTTYLSGK
ncbi:mucin-5AC-like isoform X2 [Haliotis rubra]|uniref:mucin-5AC-like isoform X2 n=1 Tax=Haliotis rubra TaxID=36100 RepID=UPI001EE5B035|nr:mucin-5AC-like isoform X2 [Haliotis rubra]